MPTPSIQTLTTDAQQILNLDSISSVRSVVAVALANANTGTPLNPNLTTQQLWDQFYQVVTRPKSDIESIIANQLMKFLYSPPAPGGAGADKQVIFNDGGVLAGDADFLWNKTTNLLTVTGSATITGDLTVDTNTLKVDSANNRVGIVKTTPAYPLDVGGRISYSGAIGEGADTTVSSIGTSLLFGNSAGWSDCQFFAGGNLQHRIQSAGVFTWYDGAGGTRMTLNSNGLIRGGTTPDIVSSETTTLTNIGNIGAAHGATTGTYFVAKVGAANGIVELKADARSGAYPPMVFTTGGTERLRIDSSGNVGVGGSPLDKFTVVGSSFLRGAAAGVRIGDNGGCGFVSAYDQTLSTAKDLVLQTGGGNVGIGVTPSAWGLGSSGYRAFEIGAIGNSIFSATNDLNISSNAYYLAGWKYGASSYASQYSQGSGKHIWYTAPSGTAGNAITFTQAMTLTDAGELLVGTTSTGGVFDTKFFLSSNSGTNKWAVGPYGTATNFAIIPTPGTGGVYLSGTSATSWTAYSDERLKDIIEPITNALTKIGSLRSVIGKFKGDETNTRRPFLIAQDLQSALPEAVDASNPDRLGVAYTDVIPLLVAAIKELTARVQTIETR